MRRIAGTILVAIAAIVTPGCGKGTGPASTKSSPSLDSSDPTEVLQAIDQIRQEQKQ